MNSKRYEEGNSTSKFYSNNIRVKPLKANNESFNLTYIFAGFDVINLIINHSYT